MMMQIITFASTWTILNAQLKVMKRNCFFMSIKCSSRNKPQIIIKHHMPGPDPMLVFGSIIKEVSANAEGIHKLCWQVF